jgi:hypothetical protein
MLRRLLLLPALVGVVALALPALAAAQPVGDSVTGSGVSSACGGSVTVDAHSGPSGENPTGTVHCGSLFSGPVTCLNVTDNVAVLNVQDPLFGSIAVRITDNGASGDRFDDVKPLPISKDQCKSGGWRTYGVFKNQGDCVGFVATKGKHQPTQAP